MTILQSTMEKQAAPMPDTPYLFSKASEMDKTIQTLNLGSIIFIASVSNRQACARR